MASSAIAPIGARLPIPELPLRHLEDFGTVRPPADNAPKPGDKLLIPDHREPVVGDPRP